MMKRFLCNLFLFFVIVAIVIGGVAALEIVAEIRAYHREVVPPQGADILLVNDSQLANAVDPDLAPRFFNFCAPARLLDQAFMTATDVLDTCGGIKIVVLDVSPYILNTPIDAPLNKIGYPAQYWLLHLLHYDLNIRNLDGIIKVARDNLVGKRLRHARRALSGKIEFVSSLRGYRCAYRECNKRDNRPLYDGILQAKVKDSIGLASITAESEVFGYLLRIANALERKGVKVVFTTTPWHADLLAAFQNGELDHFTKLMNGFCSQHKFPYLDFLRMSIPEEEWLDAFHLNIYGQRRFTPAFLKAIDETCAEN